MLVIAGQEFTRGTHFVCVDIQMRHKVAQTEFDSAEYSRVAVVARKKGLTIREALREAALRWAEE